MKSPSLDSPPREHQKTLTLGGILIVHKNIFLFDGDCTFMVIYIDRPENTPLAVNLHITISLESA
jgi:hypothetical protein